MLTMGLRKGRREGGREGAREEDVICSDHLFQCTSFPLACCSYLCLALCCAPCRWGPLLLLMVLACDEPPLSPASTGQVLRLLPSLGLRGCNNEAVCLFLWCLVVAVLFECVMNSSNLPSSNLPATDPPPKHQKQQHFALQLTHTKATRVMRATRASPIDVGRHNGR